MNHEYSSTNQVVKFIDLHNAISIMLFAFLLSFPILLSAQKYDLTQNDSLPTDISNAKDDTNKVQMLNDFSYTYCTTNTDAGIKYAQHALLLATKLRWETGIAKSYNNLGINYFKRSDFRKALEYYFKSLIVNENAGNKKGMAIIYGNIGTVYNALSDYPKALEYHLKALNIFDETGDKPNREAAKIFFDFTSVSSRNGCSLTDGVCLP